MPSTKRRVDPSLIDRLRDEPHRFEFFQAVRLLMNHYRKDAGAGQDMDILGQVIQFRSSVSLAFPASEIEALDFETDQPDASESAEEIGVINRRKNKRMRFRKVSITPSFIGLTGPMGVMPRHYTHYVADREMYHRDKATRAFLDIFTTRAVALFYQTWLKHRLHLQFEADSKNRFLPMILSLSGMGLSGTRGRLEGDAKGIADDTLAYYATALRERPQSVQWFSRVVADYFEVQCKVEQFIGQWLQLPERELTRLGTANCGLGTTTFCGTRIWDRNTKVRLTVGPMRRAQFDGFLPGSNAAENLKQFFKLMVGATFDCEVRLILDKRDLAPASLKPGLGGTRLGWNGWMKSQQHDADSHDVAYLISAADPA
ncbi:MAG TPA: type VI secretion system baseplate subunit TssG [Burkholderiaceae bacterium]